MRAVAPRSEVSLNDILNMRAVWCDLVGNECVLGIDLSGTHCSLVLLSCCMPQIYQTCM